MAFPSSADGSIPRDLPQQRESPPYSRPIRCAYYRCRDEGYKGFLSVSYTIRNGTDVYQLPSDHPILPNMLCLFSNHQPRMVSSS